MTLMLVLLSCEKDISHYPNINFVGRQDIISQNTVLKPNEDFKIGINAFSKSNSPLYNFKLKRTYNNDTEIIIDSTLNTNNFNVILTCPTGDKNEDNRWSFSISCKDGYTSEISVLIRTCDTVTYIEKDNNLIKNYVLTNLPDKDNNIPIYIGFGFMVIMFLFIIFRKKKDYNYYIKEINDLKRKLYEDPARRNRRNTMWIIVIVLLFYLFILAFNYAFLFF